MFRRKPLLVLLIIIVMGFASCKNEVPDTYYFAIYEISQTTFNNLNFNLTPTDALTWVRAQQGTGSAPVISRGGYNLDEMDEFLRGYFSNWSGEDITQIIDNLRNSGYYYSRLTGGSSGYGFLYLNKE